MQRISHYEILNVLGRGGMGVVYKALDVRIERHVALKLMTLGFAEDEQMKAYFVREAKSFARLDHPNIVTLYDVGIHEQTPFLVMQFLDGDSLEKIIKERQDLSIARKLGIIAQLCCALDYAHEQKIVHRDIKPANIMLLANDHVKILDFGIARIMDVTSRTQSAIVGTLAYMSPEQLNGNKLDGRTDIYSAGVVAYELLTGLSPFDAGTTAATMMRIMQGDIPPIHQFISVHPDELDKCIRRAVLKNREERYRTAAEFASDITKIQQSIAKDERSSIAATDLLSSVVPTTIDNAEPTPTTLSPDLTATKMNEVEPTLREEVEHNWQREERSQRKSYSTLRRSAWVLAILLCGILVWRLITRSEKNEPFQRALIPSSTGLRTVDPTGKSSGTILRTEDAGLTWQKQSTRNSVRSVTFINERLGWAATIDDGILHTEDGGRTWRKQSDSAEPLESITFVTAKLGWAVTFRGSILHSDDAGLTWQTQSTGNPSLWSVNFANPTSGWAAGLTGTILSTQNGGRDWHLQIKQTNQAVFSVNFVNPNQGWAVGTRVLRTEDGGRTWQEQVTPESGILYCVRFVTPKVGWAVGEGGVILQTDNGGRSWQKQITDSREIFRFVTFVTPQLGWVVGDSGAILHTEDGGRTWQKQQSGTEDDLMSVTFVTPKVGWAVGRSNLQAHN
jgi:serine/threonine protein kinase